MNARNRRGHPGHVSQPFGQLKLRFLLAVVYRLTTRVAVVWGTPKVKVVSLWFPLQRICQKECTGKPSLVPILLLGE